MWVFTPFTCSLEQGAELSPTLSLDTGQSGRLKSKNIPDRFCWSGSLTEAYLNSLSGTTLEPFHSTMKTHEAILNGFEKGAGNSSFVAGSRSDLAKILAALESKPDLEKALAAGFTEKSCESLAWYDQDTCSWKTCQQSFLTGWEPYSETWPRWGMIAAGVAYAHPMSALRTGAIDGGALQKWATPTTMDRLPPKSPEALSREMTITRPGRRKPAHLRDQVSNSHNRPTAAAKFPTPTATDYRGSAKEGQRRGQLTDPAMGVIPAGEKLNSRWVEWLMNWPIGWTQTKYFKAGGRKNPASDEPQQNVQTEQSS